MPKYWFFTTGKEKKPITAEKEIGKAVTKKSGEQQSPNDLLTKEGKVMNKRRGMERVSGIKCPSNWWRDE